MEVVILNEYQDKDLDRKVKVGEVLDLDDDRIEVLASVGVNVEEYVKDELDDEDEVDEDLDDNSDNEDELDDEDEVDEEAKNTLIAAYKNDKNIVNELLSADLKTLCEAFGVEYTNVADAKEALKIVTIG